MQVRFYLPSALSHVTGLADAFSDYREKVKAHRTLLKIEGCWEPSDGAACLSRSTMI